MAAVRSLSLDLSRHAEDPGLETNDKSNGLFSQGQSRNSGFTHKDALSEVHRDTVSPPRFHKRSQPMRSSFDDVHYVAANGDSEIDAFSASLPSPPSSPTIKHSTSPLNSTPKQHSRIKPALESDAQSENNAGLKLSPDRLRELAYSPESLPIRPASPLPDLARPNGAVSDHIPLVDGGSDHRSRKSPHIDVASTTKAQDLDVRRARNLTIDTGARHPSDPLSPTERPGKPQRALSTPATSKNISSPRKSDQDPFRSEHTKLKAPASISPPLPSPMPQSFPMPPLSISTYLQLELSSQRPSQLYIHRSANTDFPYESSRVKIERLLNFLLLPFHLEGVLWFGALACLDSWLYTFTILPLRLLKSFYILGQSWSTNVITEIQSISTFVYTGSGRMWRRRLSKSTADRKSSASDTTSMKASRDQPKSSSFHSGRHHRRQKSMPSMLLPDDKADMLKSLLIICTTLILLNFNASKMYHWVRGQAAIKLYVIYNILEVCDRLFSAIGQDVLECLFSREALERKPDGHSKILRPFWLFILALTYTVIHSTALFYQVITLNVAVNSYSNALITLLLSNQFVEIKSTVFKKFEKENLFQMTCADIVERFQLWHMLIIIAARNIAETGGFGPGFSVLGSASMTASASRATNTSIPITAAVPPRTASSILPSSFTLVPEIVHSITSYVPAVGHVIGPFLIVLGSEMLVDWLKHAYINKFNNTRPAIYDRFLDVLAKDYYTNAFGDQNLTKRLGLPVIPLSCLLIRAAVQTYHIFTAAWVQSTPATSSTSLASIHEDFSSTAGPMPTSTLALISLKIDECLGGLPSAIVNSNLPSYMTVMMIMLLVFFILLAFKLVLGMLLLSFARARYRTMKEREKNPIYHVEGGRRIGGWGVVEVGPDKRRWIYEDDPEGLRALQEREERDKAKREKHREKGVGVESFDKVKRYEMVAKRIW